MIILVAFGGTGNISSGFTLLHNIKLFHWNLAPFEWKLHMTWECSHLVWISQWLVTIG